MDVGAAVIAAREAAVVVQPGEGALDDPALRPKPGPVLGVALGDLRRDPTVTQLGAMAAAVVGAVGEQHLRSELACGPTGAIRSTSSSSWVMSLRLAAVTVSASGIALPQQMT